ncbi:glyoxalase family protein [Paenibacillus castaneae]|uniref:ring-cleaving dioxygenase n=1 Tax=Paenibacillus castaneae TaxID=474957 RepID=UPI000C999338|nr:ring-cleaving dioxygenase [Paenibacillus castaneae]NIK79129.1 glyoxalase family protein [Paenibacillus castaneae]
MSMHTSGIHHITAFVRNAQRTADFYAGVLGLRLIKKTINFDAPEVYHLYFGDEMGSPGTIITFFPWENSRRGRVGSGQVGYTTYVVPADAFEFWQERLNKLSVDYEQTVRFGENYLQFVDPDGLKLEIVARDGGKESSWSFGGVPAHKAIKGFGGAILYSSAPNHTADLLVSLMGLERVGREGAYARFKAAGDVGNLIDIYMEPMELGHGGSGTVHHIAWRAKDDEEHALWRDHAAREGLEPTPIIDRQYFNAIYFREPGGLLFEIATDPPGFARDEEPDKLGGKLMLPEWFEAKRSQIEQLLSPFEVRVLEEDK